MIKNKNYVDIKNCKERLYKIEKEICNLTKRKTEKLNIEEILKKYMQLEKLDRNILDEFIYKIHVGYYNSETKIRKIKIEWNI